MDNLFVTLFFWVKIYFYLVFCRCLFLCLEVVCGLAVLLWLVILSTITVQVLLTIITIDEQIKRVYGIFHFMRTGQGKFEDIKGIIRRRKSKEDRKYNGQIKDKGQTTIYKTIHRKLKNEQHKPRGVNTGATEELTVPVPYMMPVVLLLNDTNIV